MQKFFILIIFIQLCFYGTHAQISRPPGDIEAYISRIDTKALRIALETRTPNSGFLIDSVTWYVDSFNKVVIIKEKRGDHPGRVAGGI